MNYHGNGYRYRYKIGRISGRITGYLKYQVPAIKSGTGRIRILKKAEYRISGWISDRIPEPDI
jgi:hypothetical protein